MSYYEEKKKARIERMRDRAEIKADFASKNTLSLYGEASSGIPLGQPILIGHHSEKRHRKHLERIENKVRKGYEAGEEAERLEARAEAAESRTAIDSDNPEANSLIEEKIKRLEEANEKAKRINKILRPFSRVDVDKTIEHFKTLNDDDSQFIVGYLSPRTHFYACKETRMFSLSTTNSNAEIRRLEKRLKQLAVVQTGFVPFNVGDVKIELQNGQIQIEFPAKPSEETRTALKRIAMKWSSFSKKWVRKHTATTASKYFKQELIKVLEHASY